MSDSKPDPFDQAAESLASLLKEEEAHNEDVGRWSSTLLISWTASLKRLAGDANKKLRAVGFQIIDVRGDGHGIGSTVRVSAIKPTPGAAALGQKPDAYSDLVFSLSHEGKVIAKAADFEQQLHIDEPNAEEGLRALLAAYAEHVVRSRHARRVPEVQFLTTRRSL